MSRNKNNDQELEVPTTETTVETKRKGYTDEQKAEIKRRRDERNAATKALIEAVRGSKDGLITDEMRELANLAAPKVASGAGGGSKVSMLNQVKALFDGVDVVTEIDIFNQLHIGRGEMGKNIKLLIKNFVPEFRTWVKFNPETGEYVVEGRGESVPEGWTGYLPVVEIVTDEAESTDEVEA